MLGCDFQCKQSQQFYLYYNIYTLHYLHNYEHVTQPLPLNLPFITAVAAMATLGRCIHCPLLLSGAITIDFDK